MYHVFQYIIEHKIYIYTIYIFSTWPDILGGLLPRCCKCGTLHKNLNEKQNVTVTGPDLLGCATRCANILYCTLTNESIIYLHFLFITS